MRFLLPVDQYPSVYIHAGIFLNYMATKALLENKQCGMTFFKVGISIFFYVSYAILFGNFYYWTYIYKRPRNADQGSKVKEKTPRATLNRQIPSRCSHVTNRIPTATAAVANGNRLTPDSRYNIFGRYA